MTITDEILNIQVEVKNKYCAQFDCYWPRASKESFIPKRSKSSKWGCKGVFENNCPKSPTIQKIGK